MIIQRTIPHECSHEGDWSGAEVHASILEAGPEGGDRLSRDETCAAQASSHVSWYMRDSDDQIRSAGDVPRRLMRVQDL